MWEYSLNYGALRWKGRQRRNFNKGNYEKFSHLQNLGENPNEAVSKLLDKYQAAEEECIPVINPNSIKKARVKVVHILRTSMQKTAV